MIRGSLHLFLSTSQKNSNEIYTSKIVLVIASYLQFAKASDINFSTVSCGRVRVLMVVYTVFLDKVSVAVTFRIPSASISKVSSNFTSPLGAGVRPLRNISPRK